MNFVSPLMLIGVLAAAVPLAVHLVGRRRAPRRPFAALDYVLRSNKRLARNLRLHQLLLLALRMLLTAGLAVMLARPFVEVPSDLPAVSSRAQSAVLILDDTLSMSHGDPDLFRQARRKALDLVDMLGFASDVAVLRVSDPSGPMAELSRDSRQVKTAIGRLEVTARHATVDRALLKAANILAKSTEQERGIFVISDLAAHGWPSRLSTLLPKGVHLHRVEVRPTIEPINGAVVSLRAGASTAPGVRATRITARVCNHAATARRLQLTLKMEERQAARGYLKLGAWACGDKSFEHTFARGGMHGAEVSLEPDLLPGDDQRFLLLEVESTLRVLLVNGAPSPVRHLDELFYLDTALSTAGKSGQPMSISQIMAADLTREGLESHDVVVLANVRALSPQVCAALSTFIKKGGGMLISLGDQVDAAVLNHALAGLLPQELRGVVSAGSPGEKGASLRLGRLDTMHPVVRSVWTEQTGGGLRSARFRRVYRLRPATRQERRVLAWYDDGSPALLEARRGEGRVMMLTSTLDRDWNDLPIRPGFAPLVQQAIRYLGRTNFGQPRRSVEVGKQVTVSAPAGATQLRMVGPGARERGWTAEQLASGGGVKVQVERPGFHRLSFTSGDGIIHPLARESFAANVNPLESDLRTREQAGGQEGPQAPRQLATRKVELWHGLGALLLVILLLEAVLIRRA